MGFDVLNDTHDAAVGIDVSIDGYGNDTAQTLDEYLLSVRGPKHLPLNIILPLTVVYVMIFVTGVLGNIAVCVVIIRNMSLHNATNYYLFSLAVSDLTLLLLGKCSSSFRFPSPFHI